MKRPPSSFPHVMYTPPGAIANELGDIAVISEGPRIHLFHLTLPNHDAVGHAVSEDGLTWKPAETALRTGDPGECDDDMIWTMHVVKHPSRKAWHMYYTACSLAENGQVQRVALATSRDLRHWEKHPDNPVLESKKPHYNEDPGRVGFISFRDPYVFVEPDGLWHMLVTARTPGGNRFRSGCVAHATSKDGVKWKSQPPLYAPGQFEDLEVPSLIRDGRSGKYALFFNHFCVGNGLCRVSDSLKGPWLPPKRELLLPTMHVVDRFCEWKGRTLLYTWLRSTADWPCRGGGGMPFMALAPPKEVEWDADGEPTLRTFSGWRSRHVGRLVKVDLPRTFRAADCPATVWSRIPGGVLAGERVGQALAVVPGVHDDFVVEFTMKLERGRAAGFVFRADDALERATLLRLDYGQQRVELHRWTCFDSSLRRYKTVQPTLLQDLPATLRAGRSVRVRVLACGEYIEVCLDDVVHLSASTWQVPHGRLALMVEDASARFSDMTLQRLKAPLQEA